MHLYRYAYACIFENHIQYFCENDAFRNICHFQECSIAGHRLPHFHSICGCQLNFKHLFISTLYL